MNTRDIVKDSKGNNIYQIFSTQYMTELYDFNSKTKISLFGNYLSVLTSTNLLDKANGVLIDGLVASASGRKRRDAAY